MESNKQEKLFSIMSKCKDLPEIINFFIGYSYAKADLELDDVISVLTLLHREIESG